MSSRNRPPVKFRVAPPYPDESISSVIYRAACLYGVDRAQLVDALPIGCFSAHALDLDDLPYKVIYALAAALDVPEEMLLKHQLFKSSPDEYLSSGARISVCPLCWAEDIQNSRTPYFRRAWAKVLCTFCTVHQCPLVMWEKNPRELGSRQAWLLDLAGDPAKRTRILSAIMATAERHSRFICGKGQSWAGARLGMELLEFEQELQVGTKGDKRPELAALFVTESEVKKLCYYNTQSPTLLPSEANGWMLCKPTHQPYIEHLRSRVKAWTILQSMTDPGVRRAAVLMTALATNPAFCMEGLTGWPLPPKPGTDQWWGVVMQQVLAHDIGYLDEIAESFGRQIPDRYYEAEDAV